MNLKKTVLSLFAAGSILLGGVGSVGAVSDDANGQVQVNTGGTFNVFICDGNANQEALINFGTATLTSQNPTATLTANLVICYTDTMPDRGAFKTHLSSTDFAQPSAGWFTISKSNLKPTYITNVGQGQWGTGIGNIGGRTSAGIAVNGNPGASWGSKTFADGPLYVGYGNAGVGTASNWYMSQQNPADNNNLYPYNPRSSNGSWAPIALELKIPSTTVAGTYQNTFTVDVQYGTP